MSDRSIGDNSVAPEHLQSIIERIEALNAEKKGVASAISDIFAEAKGAGFNVKVLREVIRLRAEDEAEREEKEHLRDLYLKALGIF